MSIKFKVALVLAALFGGLLLVNTAVLMFTVSPGFQKLERQEAEKHMLQVLDALGSNMDKAAIESLSKKMHIPLELLALDAMDQQPEHAVPIAALSSGELYFTDHGESVLGVYAVLYDGAGERVALLRVSLDKEITAQGKSSIRLAVILMVVSAAAAVMIVIYLLQGMIIDPLSEMTRHVVRVGKTGGLSEKLLMGRRDELGLVARAFNRMQERITLLAHYDSLTGLANRPLFVDRVGQIIKLARREDNMAALFFLDLDGFKNVNDTLGHHMGDLLLKAVADRLITGLRDCDTISRMGGDEFIIVSYGMNNRDEVIVIARKIVDLFDEPFDIEGNVLSITTSVGISTFPDHGDDAENLLKFADIALYQAKDMGKNDYRFFDSAHVRTGRGKDHTVQSVTT